MKGYCIKFKQELDSVVYCSCSDLFCFSSSSEAHPFVHARSTKAAKETVDHLDATQDHLQAACGQKSSEEPNVKLHDVLGLQAQQPYLVVSQVFALTVDTGCSVHTLWGY